MKKTIIFSLFLLILSVSGCSANSKGISGTVVDAETGQPIEGAVVLVEWTRQTGIGDYHTASVKVVEKITGKEGTFSISGLLNPFVDPPDVTIYKKGYVAWSSRAIFPDYKNRTDFILGKINIFKLEHFKPEYSYDQHTSFLHGVTNSSLESKKDLIEKAYRWEELKALDERKKGWTK